MRIGVSLFHFNMTKRYQVGFDKGVTCQALADNPEMHAVVDTQSFSACGELICLCPEKGKAFRIVEALNKFEAIKDIVEACNE